MHKEHILVKFSKEMSFMNHFTAGEPVHKLGNQWKQYYQVQTWFKLGSSGSIWFIWFTGSISNMNMNMNIQYHIISCQIFAGTDGGPRFLVCARLTLRSVPHRQQWKYLAHVSVAERKWREFPLAPMGVLAPGSAHAWPSARPPIDTSGNFSVHVLSQTVW